MSAIVHPRIWVACLVLASGCRNDESATPDAGSSSSASESSSSDGSSSGTSESSTTGDALAFCGGAFEVRYDLDAPGVDAYPDNLWTEDADTSTGLRLVSPLDAYPDDDPTKGFPSVFSRMPTLDGFGATAPVFVRLTGPVDAASLPPAGTEADAASPLVIVDLDADPVAFVEYEWRIVDERDDATTLMLAPLRPLAIGHRHGVAMTRSVTDTNGDCFAPSATMQAVLSGTAEDERLMRLADDHVALQAALVDAGTITEATDLSAAIVYTTATTIRQSTSIANAIANSLASPSTFEDCFATPYAFNACTGTIRMVDFTDDDGIIAGVEPVSTYDIRWNAYVPDDIPGPWPTIVFGHALTGSSESGWIVASFLGHLGFAVIGIDAPKHGDHPDIALTHPTFDLLGLSNDLEDPFNPFVARDNFRQAAFDKLQLVRLIREGLDVTGDGTPDLDPERMHYVGHSLGAVMGPQLLATTDAFHATSLVVGGANLTNIVDEASEFQPLIGIVTQDFDLDQRTRLLAITQTVMDAGDPMAYAPFVLGDRIDAFAGRTPHVLMQLALDDTIVPNSSTEYLARSLGVALASEDHVGMRGIEPIAELPALGNHPSGVTAALWQFALMSTATGPLVPAMHRELQDDPIAYIQRVAFHAAVLEGTTPPIDDPFEQ